MEIYSDCPSARTGGSFESGAWQESDDTRPSRILEKRVLVAVPNVSNGHTPAVRFRDSIRCLQSLPTSPLRTILPVLEITTALYPRVIR